MILLLVFACIKEPDDYEPYGSRVPYREDCDEPDEVTEWCVDEDGDGVGGVGAVDEGTRSRWYCNVDTSDVVDRIPCPPWGEGDDCDDTDPTETWVNPGVGGGCEGQPAEGA